MDYADLLTPRRAKLVTDAGFFRRAGGLLCDVLVIDLLITAPFTPLLSAMMGRIQGTGFSTFTYTQRELGIILCMFLLIYAYFVLFEYLLGQTPGMMLVRTNVQPQSLWRHLLRNCMFLPLFPFIVFWIIEPIAIAMTGRGVLERVSGTRTLWRREVAY